MRKFKVFVFELLTFKGRIGRGRFLANLVAILLPILLVNGTTDILEMSYKIVMPDSIITAQIIFTFVYILFFMPTQLFNIFKRLHDVNLSAWWWLISFIPLVNLVFILYLLLGKGTKGENKYGEAPSW